ncbi:unnamed protein product [Amoebophrya sp. A25]|nr:unnamed protein product [Amoebophrya sp. A25]|eukprot:GSA25T00019421001.1
MSSSISVFTRRWTSSFSFFALQLLFVGGPLDVLAKQPDVEWHHCSNLKEWSIPPAANQIQPGVLQYRYLRFFEDESRTPPLEEVFFVLEAVKKLKAGSADLEEADRCPGALVTTHLFAAAVYLYKGLQGGASSQLNSVSLKHLKEAERLETKFGTAVQAGWPVEETRHFFHRELEKMRVFMSGNLTTIAAGRIAGDEALKGILASEEEAQVDSAAALVSTSSVLSVSPSTSSGGEPPRNVVMHILVCHCREDLDWLTGPDFVIKKAPNLSVELLIYDKCKTPIGEEKTKQYLATGLFTAVKSIPCDDLPGFRRDECVAYLKYLVDYYDNYPDLVMFLQSDVDEHAYWGYINLILESVASGWRLPFVPLNGGRIVQNLTPCKRRIFEETFQRTPAALGTYCCAQYIVHRSRLMLTPLWRYEKLLKMLDDQEAPKPECNDIKGHSTHCLMYETIWHVLWGEADLLPLRGENPELPLFLRARDVDNESYLPVGSQYMSTVMSLTTEEPGGGGGGEQDGSARNLIPSS